MKDYERELDAEVKRFILETERLYPDNSGGSSIGEQRDRYNAMCRAFAAPRPAGVTSRDRLIDEAERRIPSRVYQCARQSDAKVMYFHGGGFVVGGLDSHDDVCAEICARTGYETISVDYALAPERIFPADFDDALTAFEGVAAQSAQPIVLVGDSAGGCLVAALSHALRGRELRPCGQVLIYPVLGGDMTSGSYLEHSQAPMLSTRDVEYYHTLRTGGNLAVLDDPRCSPLRDMDFSDLPATYIVTADCDPLASDGEAYRDKLRAAGGAATWINEKGLVHAYLRARHTSAKANDSFERILAAISRMGRVGN